MSQTTSDPRSVHPSNPCFQPFAAVPATLRDCPQWVCWHYEQRGNKPTKAPLCARRGTHASSTDPNSWNSFEFALSACQHHPEWAGVGFVFSPGDPFCGIDLDDCIDDEGQITPAAQAIIEDLNSYTEISPSGKGVKIFIRGRKPGGVGCRSKAVEGFGEIEIYDRDRFFAVTGRHVPDTPLEVEERQAALEALCARLWPKRKTARPQRVQPPMPSLADDEDLLQRARGAKNGAEFDRLWSGDTTGHGDDESAADLALCNHLAFWTGRDADRMDRLFRQSGLMRPKWDERRGERTYGQMTIEKAIEGCTDVYSATGRAMASRSPSSPIDEGQGLLGQRDPASGRLVLCPKRTLPTAEAYIGAFHSHPDGPTLRAHAGVLMEWRDNAYRPVEEAAIANRLHPWLHEALRPQWNRGENRMDLVDFDANPTTVKAALETIRTHLHLPASTPIPSWLDEHPDRPPAAELLPCRSLTLHLPTGRVVAPTPALFTTTALDFDYQADPEPPMRWLTFLDEVFGKEVEAIALLQEWMGYCLTPDTSQQKMLLMVGPRRSGKGTIGRILRSLIGPENVAAPTTGGLAGTFGLQTLLDRTLAIVSDARFGGEHVGTVIERLLCISGEDAITIDRKYLPAVTMRLPTRFMFLTNELPRLRDSSAALAGRFLVLRLERSFYGQEDPTLTGQLLAERPGILTWAIEGWKRLQSRGRFEQPGSAADVIREMEDLGSPVRAFVGDRCIVGVGRRIDCDVLYGAWDLWCQEAGMTHIPSRHVFGRDLAAAFPEIRTRRGTGNKRFYDGIDLAHSC